MDTTDRSSWYSFHQLAGSAKRFIPQAALALLVAGCHGTEPPRSIAPDRETLIQQLNREAEKKRDHALKSFHTRLTKVLAANKANLQRSVNETTQDLSTYRSLAELIFRVAIDNFRRKSTVDPFMARKLVAISRSLKTTESDFNKALESLDNDLRHASEDLSNGLIDATRKEAKAQGVAVDTSQLQAGLQRVIENFEHRSISLVTHHKNRQGLIAKITPYVTDVTKRTFGPPLNTLKNKIASGWGLSIADGPLPLGEIKTVASLLWVAYDLSKVHEDFRKQVNDSLNKEAEVALQEIKLTAEKLALNRVEEIEKLNTALTERAILAISEDSKNRGRMISVQSESIQMN